MSAEPPPSETPETPSSGEQDARGLFDRLRDMLGLGTASVREDIEDALSSQSQAGDFTPHERTLLRNVLQLHDVRVKDVMIPRADVVALRVESSVAEALEVFRTAGHSRLPVYHETLDDPRGMVHIRDLVAYLMPVDEPERGVHGARSIIQAGVVRAVLYAPPSMPALDLLVRMQTNRTHMALVVDEYGGTDGLVSIEDLVEAIVGDIEDEHDEREGDLISEHADGAFFADARASLEEVSKATKFDFSTVGAEEDVDTIGGLLVAWVGRVPSRGEILAGPGDFEFEVLDADPRRIKRLRLRPARRRADAANIEPRTPKADYKGS